MIRSGVMMATRPDRIIRFAEVEYQPSRQLQSSRTGGQSMGLSVISKRSSARKQDSDEESGITRRSGSSFGIAD